MHLLLPLAASLLFVSSLILINRASEKRISSLTVLFFSNECAALLFTVLWWFGGDYRGAELLYQPLIVAALFMLGLICTFMAVQRGDVSVATPVLGIKVVFVALLLTWVGRQRLPIEVWYAAALASLGIGLIQWTGQGHPRRVLFSISLAVMAASCYATFDVLVQAWSPAWGAGRFLPLAYWMVGGLSLAMVPWVQWSRLRDPGVRRLVLVGAFLMACQAICIVLAISLFGDAARVNVVYALRGLWSVILAWAAARIWGGAEAKLSRKTLITRLSGALLLTIAVMLAILAGDSDSLGVD